ncbi:hypothetical protein D3C76_110950 [compost metagenome]|uniref:DUF3021 family protein n=1 Tax=Paenibacillus rhizolycopersici TaxID=2780073 RepID=A0ABS2H3U2_9BACL|nr:MULTISPECIES: DUF3021 family protein [Paenibacillus]MBM6994404.1 DUF3021 family protein [Paenibacillus rhizolycopersici]MUG86772.1 DUF3021 family protein [Paenibacillus timonensis]
MTQFKTYFTIDCISFTFVILIFSGLSLLDLLPSLTTLIALQIFAMTTCITFLMTLTDRIPWKSLWPSILVDIVTVLFSVFAIGWLFHVFPMDWPNFAVISGMSVVVYFAVYGVLIIKDRVDADKINQQIQSKHNK